MVFVCSHAKKRVWVLGVYLCFIYIYVYMYIYIYIYLFFPAVRLPHLATRLLELQMKLRLMHSKVATPSNSYLDRALKTGTQAIPAANFRVAR